MNKKQYAYLAGLMDGEGCFHVNYNKKRGTYQSRLSMTNTNMNLITWCTANVGGNFYKRTKQKAHWKDKYEWVAWGDKKTLLKLFKGMLPFLVGKRKQCEVLIELQNTVGKTAQRLSEVDKQKRVWCYEEIKRLNLTGLAETK